MVNAEVEDLDTLTSAGRLSEAALDATFVAATSAETLNVDADGFPQLLTNPAAAINAALAMAGNHTTVRVVPGVYHCSEGIVAYGHDPVTFAPRNVTLNLTGVTLIRTAPGVNLVTLRGGFAPQVLVTSVTVTSTVIDSVATPVTVLTYTAPHGLAAGDVIKLISDDPIPGGRWTSTTMRPRMGQFMRVYSVDGLAATLHGVPVRVASYATNVRSAKCRKGSANLRGGTFDVTDAMLTAANRSTYVVRMESLISSRIDDVVVERAVGPAVQLRSNLHARVHTDVNWAMNDNSAVLGYGVHENGGNFSRVTGSAAWTRHGYDEKTPDTAEGSTTTSSYGSTMFSHVTMNIVHPSFTGFTTHQESYYPHFDGCTFLGTKSSDGVTAFGFRGLGAVVSNAVVNGARVAFSVGTETTPTYINGESREVVIRGGSVANVIALFATTIRTGTHPNLGVKDDLRTIDVSGVHARDVDRITTLVNSRARMADLDVRLSSSPSGPQISLTNSDLDIDGTITIDGSGVTEPASASGYRLISTDSTVAPGVSRIVNTGSIVLRGSSVYLGGFTVPAIQLNAQGKCWFPSSTSLIIDGTALPAHPFPSTAGFDGSLAGYSYIAPPGPVTRSGYRTFVTSAQIAAENLWRELLASPEPNLLALCSNTIAGTVAKLAPGRFYGQLLTIVTTVATVTLNSGGEYGTSLSASTMTIPAGGSMRLACIGSVWRQLS